MKRFVLLSCDTNHHRFFMNRMHRAGLDLAHTIFETTSIKAPFPTGPLFEEEQGQFEEENWTGFLTLDGFSSSEVEDVNNPEALAKIRDLEPDLGMVFGTRRLKPELIELFPDGLINVHRSIASKYRGLDCEFWAAYHGDWDNLGVTLHMVDQELDTGAVIETCHMPLHKGMKCHQLRYYTSMLAAEMMIRALTSYLAGAFAPIPQTEHGRYYSFMPLELKKIAQRKFDHYCEEL